MTNSLNFFLRVERIEHKCRLELSWNGKYNSQNAKPITIDYPKYLITSYEQWQKAYRQYYESLKNDRNQSQSQNGIRGRVVRQGGLQQNPYELLKKKEETLLNNFNQWCDRELLVINKKIAQVLKKSKSNDSYQPLNKNSNISIGQIYLFLSCSCFNLEKLPWESWQINGIAQLTNFHLLRSPASVNSYNNFVNPNKSYPVKKTRILAIFGDATNLDFTEEINELKNLSLAEVKIISHD